MEELARLAHQVGLVRVAQDLDRAAFGAAADEALAGAVAYVELPARMLCPLCAGRNPECHVCAGVGRIHTSSQLEVRIPPHVDDTTYIDVDLMKIKPDSFTTFRGKSLKIKISVMED